jgi:hypothetical protein
MKNKRLTNLHRQVLALTSGSLLFLASLSAQAGTITGSAHDFSASGWSSGQICVACHTPHNADTAVSEAPLWNHEITTTSFTTYSSPTFNGSTGQPAGASKLCLSCHDGTVAIDSFGGNTGTNNMTGTSVVGAGGDLSDDHPISFTFDSALASADGGLHNPATTNVTIGLGGDKEKTGTIEETMLIGGQVQCVSCHDVHNSNTVPGTNGQPLLKVSKAGSAICLTCHNK